MRKIAFLLLTVFVIQDLSAQYFGRNKPRYQSFDFEVMETPHFDIHYYTQDQRVKDFLAKDSELWYKFHSEALDHQIPFKNPMIFYNNHAEFQQTNAISGGIGVGTGGVTEGLKNRVVQPIAFSNQQTHQVLGHELVHAFQFNIILGGDSTSIQSLANIPLWVIEGMAEYMSIGRVDPYTAMWMRNAILNDDVPSLQKMANPKYFPYRYGQTAWSLLAGLYGDQTLKPFLLESGKYGLEVGAIRAFGHSMESLSSQWENGLRTHFDTFLRDKKESTIGKKLLSSENSGKLNVSPSLSPNGRWVVFLSEKDLFSTDLFLADARTGKIERKLSSLVKEGSLDNFNFLESAGAWSPNSRQFAFVAFKQGHHVLVVKDIQNGKTQHTYKIPGVPAITNPTWSPDGKEIVFAGSVDGITDLYSFNLKRKTVRQLTDDIYSEIQPNFNADGTKLVFSYDKRSMEEGRVNGRWTYDLAIMDYATQNIEILNVFHGADNINPNYDDEGNIYFLSDRDGYRNLYYYKVDEDEVLMMTDFLTGLSGIARYSPAISASVKRDRVLFTHYYGSQYIIKEASREDLLNEPVNKLEVDQAAGTLPGGNLGRTDIVIRNLDQTDKAYANNQIYQEDKKYSTRFKLDNISGGVGAGINNGSQFGLNNGLQAAGALQMFFSDILGNHQLIGQAALNGTVNDFGAQLFYINRKSKLAWGGGISHVPQAFSLRPTVATEQRLFNDGMTREVTVLRRPILRVYDQTATGFVQMPFSTTLRVEGGASIGHQSFGVRSQNLIFQDPQGIFLLGSENEKIETGDALTFNQFFTVEKGLEGGAYLALVKDNSYFGLTAPLFGERYRLSFERSIGINDYYAVNADYRKYFWFKPVSFAIRGQFYRRFREDVSSIYPNYIGQMGLVRGYDFVFDNRAAEDFGGITSEQLLGSSFGLAGAEIRLPFTGPKQLALIGSNVLFTDLALFFDAGVAFNAFDEIGNDNRKIVSSVGAAVRINLFGAMILEPYWAYPLQSNSKVVFGLNFIPGW